MFVDASALVSIIAGEADAAILSKILSAQSQRLCSAISLWETSAGLSRSYRLPPEEAARNTDRFVRAGRLVLVGIGDRERRIAQDAFARFGKGRHPAALNMGDCFAYACAKANEVKLLYKGKDFAKTDLA